MASYELLDQSNEDALHAARLLNVEEKLYKRLTKRLLGPGSLVSGPPQAPPTPPPESRDEQADVTKQDELEKRVQQREQWRQDACLDFATFDSNIVRAQLLLKSNERERQRYADEKEKILETAQAVRHTNAALHEQLNAAQRTLEVRKGYDDLAEKITSNRNLKPREEQLAQIDKLHLEIAELEKESQEYAQTWAERREQFGKIVEQGWQMLRLIRDEKEEAERKEGMEDMEHNDDRETSPSPREGISHTATPAGGATPIHVSEVHDKPSPSHASKLRDEVIAVDLVNPSQVAESQPADDADQIDDSDMEEGEELSGDLALTNKGPTIKVSTASPAPHKTESNADQMDMT